MAFILRVLLKGCMELPKRLDWQQWWLCAVPLWWAFWILCSSWQALCVNFHGLFSDDPLWWRCKCLDAKAELPCLHSCTCFSSGQCLKTRHAYQGWILYRGNQEKCSDSELPLPMFLSPSRETVLDAALCPDSVLLSGRQVERWHLSTPIPHPHPTPPGAWKSTWSVTFTPPSFYHCNMGFPWLHILLGDKNDFSYLCPDLVFASNCTCYLAESLGMSGLQLRKWWSGFFLFLGARAFWWSPRLQAAGAQRGLWEEREHRLGHPGTHPCLLSLLLPTYWGPVLPKASEGACRVLS